MRRTLATLAILIFSFTFLCLYPNEVYGFEVKFDKGIKFEEGAEAEIIPGSFCVSEDGLFLIPDDQDGTIKTFYQVVKGSNLKFLKKFGCKGFGSDEFNRPGYCFYDNHFSKFGVSDFGIGTKKVFIYDLIEDANFKLMYKIPGVDCYDMRLWGLNGDQLIISGYVTDKDKRSYELYSINLKNPKQKEFLMPSYEKYHLANDEEYQIEYFEKRTLPALGIRAFIDVYGDDVYFVWEAKLKIIKVNLTTKEITVFGHPTPHYTEPVASAELVNAHRDKDYRRVWQERMKMSFVRDIFATSQYIFVVYDGPGQGNFWIQMYTPEGKFLGEKQIELPKDQFYQEMWLEKQSNTLYSLSRTGSNKPQILIYKVIMN
jgi:hypothetical protein